MPSPCLRHWIRPVSYHRCCAWSKRPAPRKGAAGAVERGPGAQVSRCLPADANDPAGHDDDQAAVRRRAGRLRTPDRSPHRRAAAGPPRSPAAPRFPGGPLRRQSARSPLEILAVTASRQGICRGRPRGTIARLSISGAWGVHLARYGLRRLGRKAGDLQSQFPEPPPGAAHPILFKDQQHLLIG